MLILYLGVAANSTADGCGIACNHTPVHEGRRELGGTVDILLFEGLRVIGQTWTGDVFQNTHEVPTSVSFKSILLQCNVLSPDVFNVVSNKGVVSPNDCC